MEFYFQCENGTEVQFPKRTFYWKNKIPQKVKIFQFRGELIKIFIIQWEAENSDIGRRLLDKLWLNSPMNMRHSRCPV